MVVTAVTAAVRALRRRPAGRFRAWWSTGASAPFRSELGNLGLQLLLAVVLPFGGLIWWQAHFGPQRASHGPAFSLVDVLLIMGPLVGLVVLCFLITVTTF